MGRSVYVYRTVAALCLTALLASCATSPPRTPVAAPASPSVAWQAAEKSDEVVMYAMGLMGTDYRFGGNNPESGLDCSGMVSYIYRQAVGLDLPHNAYQIAQLGRKIPVSELRPGDLVFFNTLHRPYSHVGIYIGNGRFIHAPATNGKISISSLKSPYFAKRFDGARSFFAPAGEAPARVSVP